ncbi:MAG: hypothetical protein IT207_02590 [Fimbriimonadaceae bacterium]|nr:hypothetical protein [Fimbriimonadaceae bacterium]
MTSTRNTIRCTVTIEPGEGRLLEIKVVSQIGTESEEELDLDAFPPEPAPPVPQAELLCHFDSTHWEHGKTVTFKIYARTPENPVWKVVKGGTTTRGVVNGFVLCVDTGPTPSGTYAVFKEKLETSKYGELPGLDSASWTKGDYLGKLPSMQVHVVFSHGNPGGLVPPGGGGTIFANDVRDAVPGPQPSTKQAMIGACNASSTEAFLKAYLREEEPSTTNRFTIGFRKAIEYQVGEMFFRIYIGRHNEGDEAEAAVALAAAAAFGEEEVPSYRVFGDPNARLRWLYDGTPGNRIGVWKVAP